MSETTDKINKLVKQHEVIGVKTDCKYFSNIGNLCSRVENGMMRCDEYLECEFKYIDALKEENEKQKEQIKQLEDFIKSDGEIDHINHEYTYKLKKVLQEVKSIAKGIRSYLEVPAPRDIRFEMDRILDLISKAELFDPKESEER